ncbi:p-hydroxybenzoate 3-monooxygenase [Quadrisphaera granulorum]|uniref:p-hydroxybenzoate 3-monooxygenase n=1 Tax=Quadrisphaera granulorum TaxID=317664 RepID=A0A316ABK2_9ACTN|nr:4-hydroxybenzoate 3-monooxygenase [Quadrisphaera granulorum]PWJ54410.1 p-hydroxybenzoate 3-monooxygenase [Quadrisphaera granulorum]SZE96182.1 p-hydroxybenzoate 3-monooxygenase [Quadrisphaera granulorum]
MADDRPAALASSTRTPVGIVGGGPAGLVLSHLLHRAGVPSVVVDSRSREEISTTVRAGILEHGTVQLLLDSGVYSDGASRRVLEEGYEHEGVELAFGGRRHRVDFHDLVAASVWLYPQTEVFADLAHARERDGGDVRFGVQDARVVDLEGDQPRILYRDAEGLEHEVLPDFLVGADGSRSACRRAVPEGQGQNTGREYPFAWFGFLTDAPASAPELVYSHSPHGFALVSQRTDTVQRMYFQCDPDEDVTAWSEDRIWEEMRRRTAVNGLELKTGPVRDAAVLRFRSFVHAPLRHGRMLLAGDAAHTVPPTGAKGLNLAVADVRVLAPALADAVLRDDTTGLDTYSERALERVWKAQHFSYWMTTMLHTLPGSAPFDVRRQEAELATLAASRAGQTLLAEGYTGWPGSQV